MKNVKTVCISLEPRFVELLDRVARRVGSKSEAVRALLLRYQEVEAEREMEQAYSEYFADPAAQARDRELTQEMLSVAAWPEEGVRSPEGARDGAGKKRPARRGLPG